VSGTRVAPAIAKSSMERRATAPHGAQTYRRLAGDEGRQRDGGLHEQRRREPGEKKPVCVVIEMSNSAGVFQLDELFRKKLTGSGLEPYVELEPQVVGEEKKLIERYAL
jgi:hypothetical protein